MESMFLKARNKAKALKQFAVDAYKKSGPKSKAAVQLAVAAAVIMMPEVAFAQATSSTGANFFCYIAQYLKAICGTAALVVICLWTIEHFFGVAKLHDIVMKVGMGAAIIIGGSVIIANSGLTSSCVI